MPSVVIFKVITLKNVLLHKQLLLVVLSVFKDDFQSVLCSLSTLVFINVKKTSLDRMQIDVIC